MVLTNSGSIGVLQNRASLQLLPNPYPQSHCFIPWCQLRALLTLRSLTGAVICRVKCKLFTFPRLSVIVGGFQVPSFVINFCTQDLVLEPSCPSYGHLHILMIVVLSTCIPRHYLQKFFERSSYPCPDLTNKH